MMYALYLTTPTSDTPTGPKWRPTQLTLATLYLLVDILAVFLWNRSLEKDRMLRTSVFLGLSVGPGHLLHNGGPNSILEALSVIFSTMPLGVVTKKSRR